MKSEQEHKYILLSEVTHHGWQTLELPPDSSQGLQEIPLRIWQQMKWSMMSPSREHPEQFENGQ